ncbi:MAG: purine-nucleoside phosphorylase [Solirubrobacterales bacterium]|nr:purine-nucleoside phosphorylase [Solirubrobacterales bacterium]
MPVRLRPTAPIATDAVLVGDPGRALMLAQSLLMEPTMSNHARGLWGYSGQTAAGRELSIQATGMGGPSAALVLADLAELGVRRAIRVGTCVAIEPEPGPGDLLTVLEAHAWSGGGAGAAVLPDVGLTARLRQELGQAARPAIVASLDAPHSSGHVEPAPYAEKVDAADMQTATLFSGAEVLGLAIAAVLIVAENSVGDQADDDRIEAAAKLGGAAASIALYP